MPDKYRLCCLTKNKTNPAYIGAQIGAKRVAAELGCELQGWAPDTPDSLEEQLAQLNEAIASAPDAILISPVHETVKMGPLSRTDKASQVLITGTRLGGASSKPTLSPMRPM